ncbi:MAG: VWA domain-containing protein [Candidatus Zixiibacteriota bacterium]|nr:MAG: VWA domain-containing protein [candidate division Zixibacteria bacterium]
MRFRYSRWDESLQARLKELADLMAIYNYLLLRMNGDVEATLQLMERLQQQGYIDAKYDLDELRKQLEAAELVRRSQGGLKLSAKGERKLRRDAFEQVFQKMRASGAGDHRVPHEGGMSDEPLPEKREFRFGDNPRHIDFTGSLFNTIKRTGNFDLMMAEQDLEVFESERATSCATVLMIDISHSMILYGEDRITPAKQVAMAFTELVLTKYPKDFLAIVTFGDEAEQIRIKDLPYLSVGPYHTNTQAGLRLARRILLAQKHANKQIFMVTDGKPSMITRPNGQLYRNPVGLDPRIVNRTLDEAVICRKKRIPITTFMVTDDPYLQRFVARLTELNHGRAYFSSVNNLGDYVLWDFVSHRRKRR